MLNRTAFRFYKAGVRLFQAIFLHDEGAFEEHGFPLVRRSVVQLNLALEELCGDERIGPQITDVYRPVLRSLLRRRKYARGEDHCATAREHLCSIRDALQEVANRSSTAAEPFGSCLRLGLAILNSRKTAADQPARQPFKVGVAHERQTPPPRPNYAYTWHDPDLVRQLAVELQLDLGTLFPLGKHFENPVLRSLADDIDPADRQYDLWGWEVVELGLQHLERMLEPSTTTEHDAKPQKAKQRDRWYHEADEEPPLTDYPCGPLFGQKRQLARWILGEGKDVRGLETACREKRLWIKQLTRTRYEVRFKSQNSYASANAKRIAEESSQ